MRRHAPGILVAALAVGVLAGMALSGKTPGTKRYVAFEAAGLMREAPDRVSRVELSAGRRRFALVRNPSGGWTAEPASAPAVSPAVASHVDMAVRFMHVSAPNRVMQHDEYEPDRLEEFGLEPPRYAVALFAEGTVVLRVSFGGTNPMQTSQYVRVEGRRELYLLPQFVGREWERVIEAGPRVAPHAHPPGGYPARAGAVGPLRPPAAAEGGSRGRTGDEPAREWSNAATGYPRTGCAAPRGPRRLAYQG